MGPLRIFALTEVEGAEEATGTGDFGWGCSECEGGRV